jgi:hypothetical protein
MENHGSTTCCRPSSFLSFKELAVPFDSRITYVPFVPVGPAKLSPEDRSEALILTAGRPCSVINRNNASQGTSRHSLARFPDAR